MYVVSRIGEEAVGFKDGLINSTAHDISIQKELLIPSHSIPFFNKCFNYFQDT